MLQKVKEKAIRAKAAKVGQIEVAEPDRYRAPALDKGLDILELLADQPNGLTRAEIVKTMGRSQSEIYRMLERLVARDYVTRSLEGDRYALSLKLFVLSQRQPPMKRLASNALPVMEFFAQKAEQSCHLGVFDRGMVTVIAQVNSPGHWSLAIRAGARIPLIGTSSGHVLLAFQDEQRQKQMMLQSGFDAAPAVLDHIRAKGHWRGDSHQSVGVTDISWPVLDTEGCALAVLTCPFIKRIDKTTLLPLEEVNRLLGETAKALSLH